MKAGLTLSFHVPLVMLYPTRKCGELKENSELNPSPLHLCLSSASVNYSATLSIDLIASHCPLLPLPCFTALRLRFLKFYYLFFPFSFFPSIQSFSHSYHSRLDRMPLLFRSFPFDYFKSLLESEYLRSILFCFSPLAYLSNSFPITFMINRIHSQIVRPTRGRSRTFMWCDS